MYDIGVRVMKRRTVFTHQGTQAGSESRNNEMAIARHSQPETLRSAADRNSQGDRDLRGDRDEVIGWAAWLQVRRTYLQKPKAGSMYLNKAWRFTEVQDK